MEPNKRFFRKDIKVTREYNKRSSLSSKDSITKQIIEEWAVRPLYKSSFLIIFFGIEFSRS